MPPLPASRELVKKREALQELLQTEGWHYFVRHVLNECRGDGYVSRMGTALLSNDPVAAKVVHQSMQEVLRLLDWPKNQVQDLKGVVDE